MSFSYESLQGAQEENLLTMLVWNEQHAQTIAMMVPHELFNTTHYRKIAKAAVGYIERFGHPPQAHIRDLLESDLRRGEDAKYLVQAIDATERWAKDLHPDYVQDTCDVWVRRRRRMIALINATDRLQQGDEEGAERALWEDQTYRPRMDVGTWLHDKDLSFLPDVDQEELFSSGIQYLDRQGIRPSRGTMTLFIAPKKWGKSWWCCNVGKAAIMHGHSCLHISLENSVKLTKRRYLQSLFAMTKREAQQFRVPVFTRSDDGRGKFEGIDFHTINPLALARSNQMEILRRLQSLERRPHLLIKEFPTSSLSIPMLNAYLDFLQRTEHFKPDMLIVDSPDLMAMNSDNLRIETGNLFRRLRGIAVERDMALCCPTQGNRASDTAKIVTSRHLSEDWSKAGTADTVLTGSRTEAEKKRNLARIFVDAARDEEDSFIVLISQSYATGQFCMDSIYFSPFVAGKVDTVVTGEEQPQSEEAGEAAHGEEADGDTQRSA